MRLSRPFVILCCLIACNADWRLAHAQQKSDLVLTNDRSLASGRGGTVRTYRISSSILKETRPIHIILPASFARSAADRKYPVIIVLDGEDNVPPALAVSDELSRNGQIPECVVVAIPNLEGSSMEEAATNRVRDLTPPGISVSGSSRNERGDLFLNFIEQELLPAVDRQFKGGLPRTLIGHSSGGILATYVAATRPNFRSIIAIDTPTHFGDDWLPKKLLARAKADPTPLRYVSYEVRFGWRDENWRAVSAAAPSSWKLVREHLPRESHESVPMLAMYLGLREVFSDYAALSAPVAPTTSILPYYEKVGRELGGAVIPPRRLLENVIEDLLMEGRGQNAHRAYDMLVSGYGPPTDNQAMLARIAEVERRPPPVETVEGLLATPFPAPQEISAFLGEWVGDVWMNPAEPRVGRQTLRIQVVDGRVVGETIYHFPGEERVEHWEYLKVTSQGMTWGNMNGMRPRGLNLFEGTLKGDTLSGIVRFGGIDFRRPDGSKPPPLYFSFKRVRN